MEENIANLKRAKQQVRLSILRADLKFPPVLTWIVSGVQTWEEKERLSQLYKEEREKNLEKDEHIRRVLQVHARFMHRIEMHARHECFCGWF